MEIPQESLNQWQAAPVGRSTRQAHSTPIALGCETLGTLRGWAPIICIESRKLVQAATVQRAIAPY